MHVHTHKTLCTHMIAQDATDWLCDWIRDPCVCVCAYHIYLTHPLYRLTLGYMTTLLGLNWAILYVSPL